MEKFELDEGFQPYHPHLQSCFSFTSVSCACSGVRVFEPLRIDFELLREPSPGLNVQGSLSYVKVL